MMQINLSPQVRADALEVRKDGDKLTINGELFDFTPLPEGAVLPIAAVDCEHILGDVTRANGRIVLTLRLPTAWDAPHEAAFPQPIIDPPDGAIALPGEQPHD